ncbi:synembryn-A [Engraulis encrasicolus]|uniref:synembryn-A n=1 Tax=Engraulis encrasicolus TaxID=184585 RepID=UPI002FD00131
MKMDLNAIIEKMETGDQDAALVALQTYNKEKSQCFTFENNEEEGRQDDNLQERLAELVLSYLERDLQPACQLACLETIRILSRDKSCLGPFSSRSALETLAQHAGLLTSAGPDDTNSSPDLDRVVEALKCLCNMILNSSAAQEQGAEMQLIVGLAERAKQCREPQWNHEVRFFDFRLTFMLTALRLDVRSQLQHDLRGVNLLTEALDAVLEVCWPDTHEVARDGVADGQQAPPFGRAQTEVAMEILKILFNITFDTNHRQVDEEEAAMYRHLGAILRHCLMSTADCEDRTEELHSHTCNLLGNLPLPCLDVLILPKVQPDSIEYMGVNMDAVSMLLELMETRLDRGKKLKETLLPSLNLLTESSRIHRQTRKFLRSKILPPLRDVTNLPEVGNTVRNKLVRLMTHIDTDVKHCAAEFLFVLCKESVSRFIKYTGYGNAAGLLAMRGLMQGVGSARPGHYSEDEDSETEEYKEAKDQINPVTGRVEAEAPNPMEGMTDEQKEREAMKLVSMFDKLSRANMIQPVALGPDGQMNQINAEDLKRLAQQAQIQQQQQQQQQQDSDSDVDEEQ